MFLSPAVHPRATARRCAPLSTPLVLCCFSYPCVSCALTRRSQITEFHEAFGLFDKDGDGHVTLKELAVVMNSLGQFPSDEELVEMIKDVDLDGNHEIEFEEFCVLMQRNMQQEESHETLVEAFNILDKECVRVAPHPRPAPHRT
jgi:hypothetical protein